jgi:multicomponent Na+:H+ antiporter subunit B
LKRPSIGIVVVLILLLGAFCGVLWSGFVPAGEESHVGAIYLQQGLSDTGAVNLVSAIYLNYRLYDTFFELLIFSVAVLGVRFYLVGKESKEEIERVAESQIIRMSADLLFPPVLLIGLYLDLFGHLSPGGGFSGGVVAGSALLLYAVALGADSVARRFHENVLERVEWGILIVIVLLGLLPLFFEKSPLTDLLPLGTRGRLTSGGSLVLYNLLIGVKVFIGTWVIIHYFLRHRGEI